MRSMDKIKKLLSDWGVCYDAQLWLSEQETVEQAWYNCERGDWLLWIVTKLEVDERKLFLTRGRIAELNIHLMEDERSIAVIEDAIAYGNGEISREELRVYSNDAIAAYATVVASHAAASAWASSILAGDSATDAALVKKKTLQQSANITREIYTLQEILDAIN